MSQAAAPGAHDPYAAFRFRDYRFYTLGNLISVMGRQMLQGAILWEVYERTKLAEMLGYVGLAMGLPIIIFAIPAGQMADKYSRRKILLVTQILTAISSVGLVIWSQKHASLAVMFTLLFLAGIARAFSWAARTPFMSGLVSSEALSNAVTWNSSFFQKASVIGPALSGWLIAQFGCPFIYAMDAVFAVAFFMLLLPIRAGEMTEKPRPSRGWQDLFSGISFVWNTKIILATITLDLFAVLFGGVTGILAVYASDVLHCGAVGFGWLKAAPSIGAVIMGLCMAYFPPMKRAGRSMLFAVAWFGIGTILFGLSTSFWLSMLALAVTGAADTVSVIVRHTLVQLLTPDNMRGRVSAVNNVFIGSSNEIGTFESGETTKWFGIMTGSVATGAMLSAVTGGIATIAVVLATMKKWPEVLTLGTFASMKPITVDDQPALAATGEPPLTTPVTADQLRMEEEKEEV